MTFNTHATNCFKRMKTVVVEVKAFKKDDDHSTMLVFQSGLYKQSNSLKAQVCQL